jgi:predicted nucleic acid-binding OB-fold protein
MEKHICDTARKNQNKIIETFIKDRESFFCFYYDNTF